MTTLAAIVAASRRVGATPGRKAKIEALSEALRSLAADEIDIAVGFLAGEARQGQFGVGYATIQGAHPGAGAGFPSLTIGEVDRALERIAVTSGRGSALERRNHLSALLARATAEEQDYLIRLLLGELRQGALEGLMVDAVAFVAGLPAPTVRRAAMVAGGIAAVARAAMTDGARGLDAFTISIFQPVAPMLAQPAEDVAEALSKLRHASLEWKLDGARVQVHKSGDEVRIFTRGLNEVTARAPEIVDVVRRARARDLILDGEAIALRADASPHSFQVTMRRFGRTLDVDALRAQLPLSVFFFDCLRRDGEALVARPARQRLQALAEALPAEVLMPRLETADPAAAQAFYDDAIARGHEGVMAKAVDAVYEPGARSADWLKVKRSHTLDLVVLAAEWGHGRRKGWLSNLHLGARDPADGGFVMLGKTFKGMTDEMLAWQTEALLARELRRDAWAVMVRPELVVEVTFNDLQQSPRYPGGLALRFARVKGYRPDKRPDEADTIDTVRAIFASQGGASA